MSNTKIEDSIISAVEILADRAIAKAGFDKTIQATIKRCENKAAGQYVVKYQDSSFYAYAASPDVKYSNNTLVYVLVPGGDFKKDKTILGAVKKLGDDYITMLGDDAYDIIGRNICTLSHAEFCSYEAEPCEHLLTMVNKDESYRYIKDASHLQIKASVWNSLDQNQIDKAGNYYLGVKIKFIDNAGEDVIRDYRLGIPQMVGNPYTTVSPMKQSYIYEIDGEKVVEVIDIYVGKEGFDIDSTITDNDIFFSNIEVNAVEPLEFIGDGKLSLSIISKNGRTVTNTPGERDIILEGCLKANGVVTTNKVEYLWFIEDCVTATGADYDPRAGKGWRKIEKGVGPTQNILTVPAGSIMAKEVRYRCLAIVDDSVLSKIVKLYNLNSDYDLTIESSSGNEFYYDQGEYILTAKMTKGGNPYPPTAYYWMLMDNKGIYTILTDDGNGNLTDGGNPFKAQNVINFVKYYCVAVDSTGNILASASITITNKLEGGGYSLIIKNGIQLFKYNEKGLSPASSSNMNPIDISALYYQIYSPEGELKVDSEVDNVSAINAYWMMPADTTMLTWEEGTKPPAEDGYYKIKQQKFAYGISNSFNASKNRNEIQLIVSYNGEVLTATTNFTFTKEGGNGTNGTVYALKIIRDSSNSTIMRYELYDDYGDPISAPWHVVSNSKWSISGALPSNEISVIDNGSVARLTEQPLTTAKSADIIKLEAKNPDGYWIYAYYPVIRDNLVGMTYKLEGGACEVIFNSDCTVSSYDSTPYKVTLFDMANNDVTANYTINWRAESDVFALNKDNTLRVKGNYNASTTDAIWCEISSAAGLVGQIKIPILLIVNRYSNSALNGWDGVSIELDSTEGYFLAPQIGAGQKESDNSFTGVVMGTQQKTSTVKEIGLFGYSHGKQTIFLDSQTGSATFKDTETGFAISITPTVTNGDPDKHVISAYAINELTNKNEELFYVARKGYIYAKNGAQLGDWVLEAPHEEKVEYISSYDAHNNPIKSWDIYSVEGAFRNTASTFYLAPTGVRKTVAGITDRYAIFLNGNFGVSTAGTLRAYGADIIGKITATSGTIGGFSIGTNVLQSYDKATNGVKDGIWLYPKTGNSNLPLGGMVIANAGYDGSITIGKCGGDHNHVGMLFSNNGASDNWQNGIFINEDNIYINGKSISSSVMYSYMPSNVKLQAEYLFLTFDNGERHSRWVITGTSN